jgi:hypothetical protein
MANTKTFYSNISLAKNELLDARIENKSTEDRQAMSLGMPHIGLAVWDTDLNSLFIWGGQTWDRSGASYDEINAWNTAYDDSVVDFIINQGEDTTFTIQRRNSASITKTYKSSHTHNQNTPSDTWVITHSLNKNPSITVVDSAGNMVEGAVTINSLNQVTITFCGAFSGKAHLN